MNYKYRGSKIVWKLRIMVQVAKVAAMEWHFYFHFLLSLFTFSGGGSRERVWTLQSGSHPFFCLSNLAENVSRVNSNCLLSNCSPFYPPPTYLSPLCRTWRINWYFYLSMGFHKCRNILCFCKQGGDTLQIKSLILKFSFIFWTFSHFFVETLAFHKCPKE